MLNFLRAYTGCPTTGLQHLVLPRETLLASPLPFISSAHIFSSYSQFYPSSDSIIILNALSLAFVRALAFWEAFPGALHSKDVINRVSVDPGMKLVVASMGSRVATWAMSGVQSDTWRVHSSLHLPEHSPITALDCKSGLLAVGTSSNLSVYTLILENDLPTWSLKWTFPTLHLSRVRFSPSLMYMVSTSSHDRIVRLHLTTSGRQTQSIPHPRLVTDVNWRRSSASSRDDGILYTVTEDATLRIFMPVLDSPQRVQLHATVDLFTAVPFSVASQVRTSSIYWLDREVMSSVFKAVLKSASIPENEAPRRRIQDIHDEGWDLFLRVLSDGSAVVQAVANIDRRPPTLLRQFTLLQVGPGTLPHPPDHLYAVPNPTSPHLLTLVTSPPLTSYVLTPSLFFDSRENGLRLSAYRDESPYADEEKLGVEQRQIVRFVRTSDGEGLGALRMAGAAESWRVGPGGRELKGKRRWNLGADVDFVVVLERGKYIVTYSSTTHLLSFHDASPVSIPVPLLISLFSAPVIVQTPGVTQLIGITEDRTIALIDLTIPTHTNDVPTIKLREITSLPLASPSIAILPVDPMTWGDPGSSEAEPAEHDVLLSVSQDGELSFWIPSNGGKEVSWRCTGVVKTGRTSFSLAQCSSAKKTVLVVPTASGQELTIWDSKESEFSTGLEYRQVLDASDPINDLDWTATPDNQSILAVGFTHRVELLCQQRMTYFDESPGWGICWKIDLTHTIPHPISDSVWLKRGTLLVGAGHIMLLYGHKGAADGETETPGLFESVARFNGPLDDYHPQMILQCLLWEKVELVKTIIVNLAKYLEVPEEIREWSNVSTEEFMKKDAVGKAHHPHRKHKPQYTQLFSLPDVSESEVSDEFSTSLVEGLLERMDENTLPHLTPNEHQSLYVLIQTTLQANPNGLRYLTMMRIFYNNNRRLSLPNTPASHGAVSLLAQRRQRLRYRDMVWAFHSESQDLLLSASVDACDGGKMTWPDARAMGVFLWLRSVETMRTHMEVIARNQFLSGELRDPTTCSIFYFALGKVKLVHGLWRQAAGHKEQSLMLKFLNNDFTEPRWRTAALKNAYALLSKRRFEYAAAFFLLGGSLKDAVNVCLRNLQDFQLAIALARVVEQDEDGPILKEILNSTVLPTAFQEGNRWLASWAFWMLRRRDIAVRVLLSPLRDLANSLSIVVTEIGEPHFDDPSLALLFSQLKTKTLQTAKGTSEISGRTEFNFVLQMARVFCRMGCHALALDLVRTWSFDRPSVVTHDPARPTVRRPPSPITTRFALEPALRRRSSIMIDMQIDSEPPTRPASPTRASPDGASNAVITNGSAEVVNGENDLIARKAGIGSLMKSAKQDLSVPEFDMGSFF
ncbi:regulator of (H+)-ATPase in vacuolar membrane [Steccherinum ochraceum]|uniref:Regulator of (H+)-ATPase in vacuolar membrane n=1 Tax=Steccherinum ochraceum TaxID=92696 RepID=A0A4R0RMA3_9APHY|nr:regulator of (H+)-ATPase in vacuolar membrane [Steccherinum ochraceum]